MKHFSLADLEGLDEIERVASTEPIVITRQGQPSAVLLSIDEYRRLKQAAGEDTFVEIARRAVVQRGLPEDPLGYDTRDLRACALAMADAALSGRNRAAVEAEIAAARKRLGLPR